MLKHGFVLFDDSGRHLDAYFTFGNKLDPPQVWTMDDVAAICEFAQVSGWSVRPTQYKRAFENPKMDWVEDRRTNVFYLDDVFIPIENLFNCRKIKFFPHDLSIIEEDDTCGGIA